MKYFLLVCALFALSSCWQPDYVEFCKENCYEALSPQYRYNRKSWVFFKNKTGYDFVVTNSGNKVKITEHNISHGDHSKGCTESVEIIGHPVHLGVVLWWIENNLEAGLSVFYDWHNPSDELVILCLKGTTLTEWQDNLWEEKELPIEEQSDSCIHFVYNLVKRHEDSVKIS